MLLARFDDHESRGPGREDRSRAPRDEHHRDELLDAAITMPPQKFLRHVRERGSIDRDRLAAGALGQLVAVGHQAARPTGADITVVVDERTLGTGRIHDHTVCETSDGLELPPASIRRLVCNGRVTPIILDAHGNALDAGRTIRHASRQQRRALRAMYRTRASAAHFAADGARSAHEPSPMSSGALEPTICSF